jgi:hypothetical protein
MPWQSLGILTLTRAWVYTLPVEGELFRFTHSPLDNRDEYYLKGVVCQGFFDDGLNIFDRKLLTWREEKEAMLFYFPTGLNEHFLAFKRLDENPIVWNIKAEVFLSSNAQEGFNNYLLSRFKDLMQVFQNQIQSTETVVVKNGELGAISTSKIITDFVPQELVAANPSRESLTIHNDGKHIIVGTSLVDGGIKGVILEMTSSGTADLSAFGNKIYRGALYISCLDASVSAENKCFVDVTEFVPIELLLAPPPAN